jgi:asparagine synthetase B (glutamine-hydrolysing)
MAFWFASRGKGIIKQADGTEIPFESNARVLLSGLGADEQLGGYSRHREAFRQGGWQQMIQEVRYLVFHRCSGTPRIVNLYRCIFSFNWTLTE